MDLVDKEEDQIHSQEGDINVINLDTKHGNVKEDKHLLHME